MKTQIAGIEYSNFECVKVTAFVYWRNLPHPNDGESDQDYAERVKSIAEDIAGYNNLHIGWAELTQKPEELHIPTVEEYYM